jgi:hypothetical protein
MLYPERRRIHLKEKQWKRPELLVLVRTKPEEAVLTDCKGGAGLTSAAINFNDCALAGCDAPCNTYATT